MPVTTRPVWCLCGHADTDHTAGGRCRARQDDDAPCGCREYEHDQET